MVCVALTARITGWGWDSAGLLPLCALRHVTVSPAQVIVQAEKGFERAWADTVVRNRKSLCSGLHSVLVHSVQMRQAMLSLEVLVSLLLNALARCVA